MSDVSSTDGTTSEGTPAQGASTATTNAAVAALDPITAELVSSALIYASEEMGIAVREAAYSPNIKERLDHSCALFDARGRLVAQAEHIPVHLGSLPWGLRRVVAWLAERGRRLEPGDMIVVNDPYLAGTHLNDVTVIRAIYHRGRHVGYAANKAHHTDVGGAVPGSMPPDARDLFAEGCVIAPTLLMRADQVVDETIELIRSNSRTPESRAGDLRAQIAGNVVGERRFLELVERYGLAIVEAALDKALADGERARAPRCARCPTAWSSTRTSWRTRPARRPSCCGCGWRSAATRSCWTTPAPRRSAPCRSTRSTASRSRASTTRCAR